MVKTVASSGVGIDELVSALDAHGAWLESSGELADRRRRRVRAEIEALALDTLHRRLSAGLAPGLDLDTLAARVLDGTLDPYSAADLLTP